MNEKNKTKKGKGGLTVALIIALPIVMVVGGDMDLGMGVRCCCRRCRGGCGGHGGCGGCIVVVVVVVVVVVRRGGGGGMGRGGGGKAEHECGSPAAHYRYTRGKTRGYGNL